MAFRYWGKQQQDTISAWAVGYWAWCRSHSASFSSQSRELLHKSRPEFLLLVSSPELCFMSHMKSVSLCQSPDCKGEDPCPESPHDQRSDEGQQGKSHDSHPYSSEMWCNQYERLQVPKLLSPMQQSVVVNFVEVLQGLWKRPVQGLNIIGEREVPPKRCNHLLHPHSGSDSGNEDDPSHREDTPWVQRFDTQASQSQLLLQNTTTQNSRPWGISIVLKGGQVDPVKSQSLVTSLVFPVKMSHRQHRKDAEIFMPSLWHKNTDPICKQLCKSDPEISTNSSLLAETATMLLYPCTFTSRLSRRNCKESCLYKANLP